MSQVYRTSILAQMSKYGLKSVRKLKYPIASDSWPKANYATQLTSLEHGFAVCHIYGCLSRFSNTSEVRNEGDSALDLAGVKPLQDLRKFTQLARLHLWS